MKTIGAWKLFNGEKKRKRLSSWGFIILVRGYLVNADNNRFETVLTIREGCGCACGILPASKTKPEKQK